MYSLNGNATITNAADFAAVRSISEEQAEEAAAVNTYREFYDGEQGTLITDRLAEFLSVATEQEFVVNFCQLIVDSLAERLEVTGFTTGDDASDALLWEWWQQNRMDAMQRLVHTYAARDGMTYIIVDWNNDEGRPGYNVNEAFDGNEGIKAHWSGKPGLSKLLFASKRWREEFDIDGKLKIRERRTLYYHDRVEKYVAGSGPGHEAGWMPFTEEDNGEWPVKWIGSDGKPLGLAVIPFLNRGTGVSELQQVLPVQVALNKTVVDILAAADVAGFAIYTKTGGSKIDDPAVFPGAFWQDTNADTKWGKLEASDLTPIIAAYDKFVHTLAIITRRPLSMFTGDNVSGESLKQREAGLVAQAKAASVIMGNSWEDCMYLGAKLAETFGAETFPADINISTQWADVETRNEEAHRMAVREDYKAGIIDQQQAWDDMGYDNDQQEAMLRRAATERARQVANAVRVIRETNAAPQPANVTPNTNTNATTTEPATIG
ncbi:MAG: phage portal protein [Anaerolineae bacterium]|nr:phage portal protein [Anaerolineae bacterium]